MGQRCDLTMNDFRDESGINQLLSELDRLARLFEQYERKLVATEVCRHAGQINDSLERFSDGCDTEYGGNAR